MESTFQLIVVACVRSTGGRIRLLLAIDRGNHQLFDGEPALLVEHRPGSDPSQLIVEGPDGMAQSSLELVRRGAGGAIGELLISGFDETGAWDMTRIIGSEITLVAPRDTFSM